MKDRPFIRDERAMFALENSLIIPLILIMLFLFLSVYVNRFENLFSQYRTTVRSEQVSTGKHPVPVIQLTKIMLDWRNE